jgi:DNA-binding CsgD family transcriptional regulator
MTRKSSFSVEGWAAAIGDLYAGTLDDNAWSRALMGVADLVRARAAIFLAFDPSRGSVLREENHGVDPQTCIEYDQYWTFKDCRRAPGLKVDVGVPMTEEVLNIPDWRRTDFLNDFLMRFDIPHFMPVWLHKSDTKAVTLALQGSRKRGPFDRRDAECLRLLSPHIARAFEIRDRLDKAGVRLRTLGRILDETRFGVFILDSVGRVLETNSVAQRILRSNEGVQVTDDRTLKLQEPAGAWLRKWLAAGAVPARLNESLIHVPRRGRLPLSVVLTVLPRQALNWIGDDPTWLALAFDPEQRLLVSVDVIARDLDLTLREAEVASCLAVGFNLKQTARRLKITDHTARNHLKSIFRKTGIRSQGELMQRVSLGPASLSADLLR